LTISAIFLFALFAAECGPYGNNGGGTGPGGPAGTPAGTYQLVFSATSLGVTRITTLMLTVQ
jgi:hypothetical protein